MIIQNIIDSWKHIPYTPRHYAAFLRTEKKYIGYYKYKFHDLDKVLMYILIPWLGTKRIKKIHRAINKHHIQNHKAAWECCRLTKPQEPMSAREYLEYKKETLRDAHMDIIMKQFNL